MFDQIRAAFLSLLAALGLGHADTTIYQGYGEGDYVLVAPQIAGTVETLDVARGDHVHKGDPLFTLEHESEQAALNQAQAEVYHAYATLADLMKAKRQPELDTLVAQREEASAALQIAQINYERDLKQIKAQAISQATLDADKATLEQATAKLAETDADLATGKLSTGRDDAIHAAQADIVADEAAQAGAQWRLDQKKVAAPSDAFVFDTLYRSGEFVNAGQPVVSLLPAANIRVRFFVPSTQLATIPAGTKVTVDNGSDEPIPAHVTYVSPQAEYSPPELYNRDNREKLLFMLEATPDATPEHVHPGQPVDVVVAGEK
jgi:HlyD family secretion protein